MPIVLWEITEDCETALDVYEVFPNFYVKKTVDVIVNVQQTALVYVMASEFEKIPATPTEYSFNLIEKGYADNCLDTKPLKIAYKECLKEIF